jgi:hypothetical protein
MNRAHAQKATARASAGRAGNDVLKVAAKRAGRAADFSAHWLRHAKPRD